MSLMLARPTQEDAASRDPPETIFKSGDVLFNALAEAVGIVAMFEIDLAWCFHDALRARSDTGHLSRRHRCLLSGREDLRCSVQGTLRRAMTSLVNRSVGLDGSLDEILGWVRSTST